MRTSVYLDQYDPWPAGPPLAAFEHQERRHGGEANTHTVTPAAVPCMPAARSSDAVADIGRETLVGRELELRRADELLAAGQLGEGRLLIINGLGGRQDGTAAQCQTACRSAGLSDTVRVL